MVSKQNDPVWMNCIQGWPIQRSRWSGQIVGWGKVADSGCSSPQVCCCLLLPPSSLLRMQLALIFFQASQGEQKVDHLPAYFAPGLVSSDTEMQDFHSLTDKDHTNKGVPSLVPPLNPALLQVMKPYEGYSKQPPFTNTGQRVAFRGTPPRGSFPKILFPKVGKVKYR